MKIKLGLSRLAICCVATSGARSIPPRRDLASLLGCALHLIQTRKSYKQWMIILFVVSAWVQVMPYGTAFSNDRSSVGRILNAMNPVVSPYPWPPKLNEKYPDIPFVKPDGGVFKMSELEGRYVVIHYRGMSCPACQNGARIKELMWKDPRVVNVDILLFNDQNQLVTAADADKWARQYGLKEQNRELVVGSPSWTHAPEHYQTTYGMVIGGQLLDKDGIVRSSVVTPKGEKLPTHYWPALRSMLDGWLSK